MVEVDIAKFFDEEDHRLMLKAVAKHAGEPWVRLYVARRVDRTVAAGRWHPCCTPAGYPAGLGGQSRLGPTCSCTTPSTPGWGRSFPSVLFERYVDNIVVHCVTQRQAHQVRQALADRLAQVGLRGHPEATRIVYRPTTRRRQEFPVRSFDFLGYTFQAPGSSRWSGRDVQPSSCPRSAPVPASVWAPRVRSWRLYPRTCRSHTLSG